MRPSSAATTRAIATPRSRSSRSGRWLPPAPRDDYDFEHAPAGDEFVRLALEIEIAAQRAYTGLISRIRTDDYLLSAAFILVDEVRHMTVWQRVLGLKIY
jgi:hypothetical protein